MRPFCVPCVNPSLDPSDLDLGVPLTVTLALPVSGLVLELDDADLGALDLADDLSGHSDLLELVGAHRDIITVDEQERGQIDHLAGLGNDLVDLHDVTHGNLVLASATAHDRV